MHTILQRILPLAILALAVTLPATAAAQHDECDSPLHADAGHTDSQTLDAGPADARTHDVAAGDASIDDATIGDAPPETDTTTGCPSLGDPCGRTAADACGPDSDGCMHKTSGAKVCTCACRDDRDCGPDGTCVSVAGGAWCLPYASPDGSSKTDDASCPETACGPDDTCRGSECVAPNNEDDQPTVVVFHDTPADPDSACSLPADQRPTPGLLGWLLAAFGIAVVRV
jgi:hypothetical protein